MSHTRARRRAPLTTLLTAPLTSAVLAGSAIAPAAGAVDAGSARLASGWVADQPEDGIITSFGSFRDHGLTLDAFYALRASGSAAETRAEIIELLGRSEEVAAYTTYTDNGTTTYFPGAAGKLLTAMRLAKRDVSSVGDGTVLTDLEDAVTPSGRAGGAGVEDYGNAINQAWIVRGLALAGSDELGAATSFLLRQQCSGGWFRESFTDGVGCFKASADAKKPSVEATAYAVRALIDARKAGVTGLGDDLAEARAWLVRAQRRDGAFVGNDVPNADATGLAADALRRTGAVGAAANAAGWLLAHQVRSDVVAKSPALQGQRGAVAYDDAALADARKDGITGDGVVYQWRKATMDGVLGLLGLLPSKKLGVRAPDSVRRNAEVTVRVRGLRAGERYVLRRNGNLVARGLVPASGVAKRQVVLPRKGRTVLRVVGSRPGRVGTTSVRVR